MEKIIKMEIAKKGKESSNLALKTMDVFFKYNLKVTINDSFFYSEFHEEMVSKMVFIHCYYESFSAVLLSFFMMVMHGVSITDSRLHFTELKSP